MSVANKLRVLTHTCVISQAVGEKRNVAARYAYAPAQSALSRALVSENRMRHRASLLDAV